MHSNQISIAGALACMILIGAAGCGTAKVPRTEIVGELSLDGNPVAQAEVLFSAKAASRKDLGTYSANVVDGAFKIAKSQGPPVGDYDVIVVPAEEDSEEVFSRIRERQGAALAKRDDFVAAVARKGPIRISLTANQVNSVSIALTTN